MKTGKIEIIIEAGKTPAVEIELVNGNVWMTKNDIDRLFNCYFQKVDTNLRSIFKSGILREEEVSYTYRYTDKGIEKQCMYYNLEVVIFLSYRIATLEAQIFRQFVISALREHLQRKETRKNAKLFLAFSNHSACLN